VNVLDRRLIHVVAAARQGSFTLAAQRVGVTQSAITKSIADLERDLGFLIFNRTARGTLLTEEGRLFVERASRLLDDAKELLRGRSPGDNPYAGILRVGACPASLEWQLIEPLTLLLSRHPAIRLEVSGSSFERMVQQLRTGGVDVALGFDAAFREQPDLRHEPLPPLRTTLFARRDHPILKCDPATIADIAAYEFVSPSDSQPYGATIRNWYESQGIDAQQKIHIVDYFPIARRIVATTNALSSIAVQFTRSEAFRRRFARVPFLESVPLEPLCWAVRARWEPRPAVRAFIKACRDSLQYPEAEDVPSTPEAASAAAMPSGNGTAGKGN
jgi:DNA-binding transcriptional LysR family regulator